TDDMRLPDLEARKERHGVFDDVEDAERAEMAVVAAVPSGRAAIAALVGREYMEARCRERRYQFAPAVGELRKAMQQQDAGLSRCPGLEHVHAQAVDGVDEQGFQ